MSAHTPGPWKAVPQAVVDDVEMFEIAQVSHMVVVSDAGELWPANHGTPADDARLIAAAPELLEALRQCRQALDALWQPAGSKYTKASDAADRAIAKATGEAA